MEDVKVAHAQETAILRARIVEPENELSQEKVASAITIHSLTQLIPTAPSV